MSKQQKDYEHMHQLSRKASILSGISHLLDWDHETYMPAGSAGIRAKQFEVMAGLIHEMKTSKNYVKALSKLIDIKTGKIIATNLSSAQQAALREWRYDYLKDTALPKKFVEEFACIASQAVMAWRDAKKNDAFLCFAPFLEKLIAMSRKKADLLGYKDDPYDALLDQFEKGTSTKEIASLFSDLRRSIGPLLKKITKAKQVDDRFLFGKFPHEKQLKFAKKLLNDMGYDFSKGRLDLSSHPFSSSSHPTDSRITTRIHPTSLMSNLWVVLHEGGHSLYEMGLPVEHYGSPLGESISLGIHESQSRWWETRIGQSQAFWSYYFPLLKKEFKSLERISLPKFYQAINKVEPSFIRVEADEVTYSLHVILRFELERELINGKLKVREIPEAWNSKMQEFLGITPKNNSEGCLQDIHWSMGAFGYFPTYTLGNLYGAHFFEAFAKQHPDWEKRVAAGELAFIKQWLQQQIYQYGRRYRSKELLKKINPTPFSAQSFTKYLTHKYKEIYG